MFVKDDLLAVKGGLTMMEYSRNQHRIRAAIVRRVIWGHKPIKGSLGLLSLMISSKRVSKKREYDSNSLDRNSWWVVRTIINSSFRYSDLLASCDSIFSPE